MDEISHEDKTSLSSEQMSEMVFKGFLFQKQRKQEEFNAKLNDEQLKQFCVLDSTANEILQKAINSYNLSQRGVNKTIKVARTIADLEQSELILKTHILKALSFRMRTT